MAYFRVSLNAARAIADATGEPQLIAAYMVLRRYAYTPAKDRTAAGAKAISKELRCTDYRAKRLLSDLISLRFGERGADALAMPAADWNTAHDKQWSTKKGNAGVYALPEWPGDLAYLPDIIFGEPFARLCADPDTKAGADALLALLHLYRHVAYGDFMGAAPDRFAYLPWDCEGDRTLEFDYQLGSVGADGGVSYWCISPAESGKQWAYTATIEAITGGHSDAHKARFWRSIHLLNDGGLVCPVAVVFSSDPATGPARMLYPLWVFRPEYRKALLKDGLDGELAKLIHRAVDNAGLCDEYLMRDVTAEDRATEGTGIYYCAVKGDKPPTVLTLYAPRLHAPTPENLGGLNEVARLTQGVRNWFN